MTYFLTTTKNSIIQNLFHKLSIFKTERSSTDIWDCQWHKTSSVTPVSITLILLVLFQIIKIRRCCGFNFTNFIFFLTATNALVTSWVTFPKTRIIVFFFYFLIWFSHGSLMKINSTHVYFRSRTMLCFVYEKQKDKNTFKTNSHSEYLIY